MFERRVTFLVGHFGSGKTEITLNAALALAAGGKRVSVVDLDVVKPYFRSRSAIDILAAAGVEMVAPLGEYFTSDLPIIIPAVRGKLEHPDGTVLFDAGGDDTGVRVVGSLRGSIPVGETDFLLVLNFRRPFTPDPDSAVQMAREIQVAARFPLTGVFSNTHLMNETTPELVREGLALAQETARRLNLPVVGVAADASLKSQLGAAPLGCPVLYLDRMVMPPHEQPRVHRRVGPLFKMG
jgi:hypothetical protein